MEHHNTGKTPKNCYSCIDEGMDKLTVDVVKYVRARLLSQMSLSADSSRICYNTFPTCWTSKAKV